MTSTTDVSTTLATEINAAHEAACQAARSALNHARRAGELLNEAKAGLEHGAWLPWLAEHCPTIPERTAQAYMRIARRWPELEANPQRVADLPVREALALLAEPRYEADEPVADSARATPLDRLALANTRLREAVREKLAAQRDIARLPNEHTLEQWRQLTTPNGLEAAVARAVRAAVRAIEDDSKDDPSTEPVAPDDWPARTAAMEAAWDDLGAKLDALNARIGHATDISDALDAIDEATGLEGRAIALHASTRRDLRRLTRELAGLLDLPVPLIQPLTRPERAEAFLTACHARIAELSP